MNWTAQQKIRLGFWLLILVPIVLGVLATRNAYELADAARHVAVTNDIGRRIEKLFSEIKDVEVAQREYILNGGSQPVRIIKETYPKIEQDIKELRELKADPRWLTLLESLIPEKFDEIQQTIELRDDLGREAASQALLTNRGQKAMDDIRRVVANMRLEEDRRLSDRSAEQQQRFNATFRIFGLILLLNLGLIAALYMLQRRETERIRHLNEELEHRVALRTEALQRSNEDLQQFAYVASHDMKEPLRMISSYATLLQRKYAGQFDSDADLFINYIVDGARRMNALINDLLDYSRAGGGSDDDLSAIDVKAILRNVLTNLKVTMAETGATVTWENLPESVLYDPVRLTQVFQNLISNAIKYRGERRPVVRIGSEQRPDEIIFSVRDNGIGIEPEYIERIFGIFQRLHGKEYEGTGIGLAMVKKIVERYGGRVWVESTPDVGSTFYFTVLTTAPLGIAEATSTTTS
jgi:signal transduction histidine kinase